MWTGKMNGDSCETANFVYDTRKHELRTKDNEKLASIRDEGFGIKLNYTKLYSSTAVNEKIYFVTEILCFF